MTIHHFVINLIIRKDNNILLEKRNDSGENWKFPGGHVEPNENLLEACKREAKEEVGINIKLVSDSKLPEDIPNKISFIPSPVVTYIENKKKDSGSKEPHTHTAFVFFAATSDDPKSIENQETKLFNKEDLLKEKNIIPEVKNLSLRALETDITSHH